MDELFGKLGNMMTSKPKQDASLPPSMRAGMKPATGSVPKAGVPGANKPFDINLYFTAVGMFFNDFFNKKLPYFFQNMGPVFSNFPNWWGKLPQDEQISYGVLAAGHVMFVVGIVLFIVM